MSNIKTVSVKTISGHWVDQPDNEYTVIVSLGSWNGLEDHIDQKIFFYTDGEPINVGDIIAEDFLITKIH